MRIRDRIRSNAHARRRPRAGVDGNVSGTGDRTERERGRPLERHRRGGDRRRVVRPRAAPPLDGDGARCDIRRRRRCGGRSRAVRNRSDRTAGGVRRRGRPPGCTRRPGRPGSGADRGRPVGLRHVHGVDPGRPREGRRARPLAPPPPPGMLAMRTGDHFDDVVPYVQPTPGPGGLRADRADAAGRRQAGQGASVHVRLAVQVPAGRAVRADEQALRAGCGRS